MRFMIVIHNIYRRWKTRQSFISKDFRGTKGSLSNDDGDGNENDKKQLVKIGKTTTWHVHHAFMYISLPLQHVYDAKRPNFTFYGGREHN